MRAAHAVAPNLAPPPEERRSVSETKPLHPRKYRRCRRSAPPCRHADRLLQWRFLHFVPAPHQGFLEGTMYGESTVN